MVIFWFLLLLLFLVDKSICNYWSKSDHTHAHTGSCDAKIYFFFINFTLIFWPLCCVCVCGYSQNFSFSFDQVGSNWLILIDNHRHHIQWTEPRPKSNDYHFSSSSTSESGGSIGHRHAHRYIWELVTKTIHDLWIELIINSFDHFELWSIQKKKIFFFFFWPGN